ncbi:DUF4395 domain-containing protein [Mycolicibacterium sp. S2-37]|uniref:DUF4395 domain-containing protein n=1 Tax=Mycolicibacterium sp. S2-37 TaxID=2810297 RepID=UPI001A943348|nr:DUF4395 domain-containing protein [Mycolicibacterium sp. S2-37]MBO0680162.1 DUF4395 domain-containing protein [Mycolicibacterium sp. S2-37]
MSRSVPQIDVRGPRFAAWLTTAVLVATIMLSAVSTGAAGVVLGAQAVVFAIGATLGPQRHPYGIVFARLVAPRVGPVTDREPVAPLKFAQLVGLVFAGAGTVAFAAGAAVIGVVFTAFALLAAFLNAAFGICLGCQLYPLAVRLRRPATTPASSTT